MSQFINEIITSEYVDNAGNKVEGIYCTQDSDFLLVDTRVCSNLLSWGIHANGGLRQQIKEELIKSGEVIPVKSKEEVSEIHRRCLEIAHSRQRIKKMRTRAEVLKLILSGSSKSEASYQLGISRRTVTNVLTVRDGDKIRDLNEQEVRDIWDKYYNDIFQGVDSVLLEDYIKAGCNYKEYHKAVIERYRVERRRKREEYREELEAKSLSGVSQGAFKPDGVS